MTYTVKVLNNTEYVKVLTFSFNLGREDIGDDDTPNWITTYTNLRIDVDDNAIRSSLAGVIEGLTISTAIDLLKNLRMMSDIAHSINHCIKYHPQDNAIHFTADRLHKMLPVINHRYKDKVEVCMK